MRIREGKKKKEKQDKTKTILGCYFISGNFKKKIFRTVIYQSVGF